MRGFVLLPIVLAMAVFAATAAAHVTVLPTFLASGESADLAFTVPNEIDVRMTSFQLTVPAGMRIVEASPAEGWRSTRTDKTASWTGGTLAPAAQATFVAELAADRKPGRAVLDAKLGYPGGGSIPWPVELLVTPADEPSQQLGAALVAAIVGVLVLALVVALAWRRRTGSLQEE